MRGVATRVGAADRGARSPARGRRGRLRGDSVLVAAYSLRRSAVRKDLRTGRVLGQLGIDDVTDEDIDRALDDEDNR